jgi:tetratricopeptide (TPR) repeat protein
MLKWFKNLSDANKIAIVIPVALAAIAGLFGLFKWLSPKKDAPAPQQKTIHQEGTSHTASTIDGDKNIIAGGNVSTGIDSEAALTILVDTSAKLGRSEAENTRLRETIKQLEEQLAKPSLETSIALQQSTPAPSAQARELASLITEDDGLYAQALKAIAEGDNEKADSLLDETQQFLDTVQERKDQAQAKIYIARIQNASYAGRPRDALQYCDKLTTLAGNDSPIINEMAVVYYQNAKYKEAEPLMQRALKIDEASFGKDHPTVAIRLNNLAALYQATNRLKEAEPLMQRAIEIDEASFGKDHPEVATDLNNLAALYQATNRVKEADPLFQRALKIDEASFGKDHPNVARDLNNLAQLYKATNRLKEAEPLMQRALEIDEASLGKDHPKVATDLNNLAQLYQATNRLPEAEPLMKRAVEILLQFTRRTGHPHPHLQAAINNYNALLMQMGHSEAEVAAHLKRLAPEMFESTDNQPKEQ